MLFKNRTIFTEIKVNLFNIKALTAPPNCISEIQKATTITIK